MTERTTCMVWEVLCGIQGSPCAARLPRPCLSLSAPTQGLALNNSSILHRHTSAQWWVRVAHHQLAEVMFVQYDIILALKNSSGSTTHEAQNKRHTCRLVSYCTKHAHFGRKTNNTALDLTACQVLRVCECASLGSKYKRNRLTSMQA